MLLLWDHSFLSLLSNNGAKKWPFLWQVMYFRIQKTSLLEIDSIYIIRLLLLFPLLIFTSGFISGLSLKESYLSLLIYFSLLFLTLNAWNAIKVILEFFCVLSADIGFFYFKGFFLHFHFFEEDSKMKEIMKELRIWKKGHKSWSYFQMDRFICFGASCVMY